MQPSVESRAAIRGNPQTELVIPPRPDSRGSLSHAPPPSLARSGVLHRQVRVASRAPLSPRPTGPGLRKRVKATAAGAAGRLLPSPISSDRLPTSRDRFYRPAASRRAIALATKQDRKSVVLGKSVDV